MSNLEKAFEAIRNIEELSYVQRYELIEIIGNLSREEFSRGFDKADELNKKYN